MSTFRIIALKVLDDSPKYQSIVLMPCTTYFFFRGYGMKNGGTVPGISAQKMLRGS